LQIKWAASSFVFQHGRGDLTSLVGLGQGTNIGEMGKSSTIVVVASDLYEEAQSGICASNKLLNAAQP